jgi:hypothetical protein
MNILRETGRTRAFHSLLRYTLLKRRIMLQAASIHCALFNALDVLQTNANRAQLVEHLGRQYNCRISVVVT